MNALDDVRRITADLALPRAIQPGACAHWAAPHVHVVRANGLAPWLYARLRKCPEAALPAPILGEWRQEYRSSAIRALYREVALKRLLARCEARGIACLLLKGAYLGACVYGDSALRPMGDVDVMVREERLREMRQVLADLGYRPAVGQIDAFDFLLQPAQAYVPSDGHGAVIDLHWGIRSLDYYRFPASAIWSHAAELSLHGSPVFCLLPELSFLHLAVHTLNHDRGLRDRLDLLLVAGLPGFSWERLGAVAHALGMLRPVYWLISELRDQWGLNVPAQIFSLAGSYSPHWLEDRVMIGRNRYLWRLWARTASLGQWSDRLRYLANRLVPPAEYRRAVLGTSRLMPYFRAKLGCFHSRHWRNGPSSSSPRTGAESGPTAAPSFPRISRRVTYRCDGKVPENR